jgi:hypothetical protein
MKLVTIFNGFNPADAQLVRSRLEAAGFDPFIPNENSALGTEGYAMAVGGIQVQVPEDQVDEVKAFLAAPPQDGEPE